MGGNPGLRGGSGVHLVARRIERGRSFGLVHSKRLKGERPVLSGSPTHDLKTVHTMTASTREVERESPFLLASRLNTSTNPTLLYYDPDWSKSLVNELEAAQLDPDIAYLTSHQLTDTPFARAWRVESWHPFGVKRLRALLRQRGVGQVVVKKRGSTAPARGAHPRSPSGERRPP